MELLVSDVLARLASARPIDVPAVLVVAHPDDEVLAMGGRLRTFRDLTVIQLTDGAPASGADARRLGFAGNSAYATVREQEAHRACATLGLRCPRIALGAPDQDSIFFARHLIDAISRELRHAALVFTHPYEGGHPDHDTAALIVQRACAELQAGAQTAPARFEFASYHLRDGGMHTGAFCPAPQSHDVTVRLAPDVHELKHHALAAYASQAKVLSRFDPGIERYRTAPDYDFTRAPPPGAALYDRFGWDMTAAKWRALARPLLSGCEVVE
ncbi:PIG-L deacetylase family protein [Bradyrhizobium sp. HKCCYLS1011]|uniref:PIG-L deacetylase family protein n=1 Tax=Bradyrhizobium sp. HKCCYLS1011 TaxID=3420733 RepID=UPI003EB73B47